MGIKRTVSMSTIDTNQPDLKGCSVCMLDSLSVPDNLLKGFIDCTKRAAWAPWGLALGQLWGPEK